MNKIKKILIKSSELKNKISLDKDIINNIQNITDACIHSLLNNGSVYWCGNGGSAADAQHLAAELSGRFYFDREPLSSEALHCNTSYITAVGNDYGYEYIFSRLIKGIGKKGDILIGLSTSGKSKNIINAFKEAKSKGIICIGLTGESGNDFEDLCDYLIKIPSDSTPRIQECHITIGHIICELIEKKIFKKNG